MQTRHNSRYCRIEDSCSKDFLDNKLVVRLFYVCTALNLVWFKSIPCFIRQYVRKYEQKYTKSIV